MATGETHERTEGPAVRSAERLQDAAAGEFSEIEIARLERGKSVKRKFSVDYADATYHAGISYRLVDATPMDVFRALRRPSGVVRVIPYGLAAKVLGEKDGVTQMRISQGKRPVVGTYTVRIEWDLRSHSVRFWKDPSQKADLEDIWGVFTAREIRPGKTLVSFGFAFNMGGVGSLLSKKAQTWGLTTADRIAEYLEEGRP